MVFPLKLIYWQAFGINSYLTDQSGNPPTGALVLTGNGQKQSFDHKIIRIKPSNADLETTTELKSVANVTDISRKKLPIAIPAPDEQ